MVARVDGDSARKPDDATAAHPAFVSSDGAVRDFRPSAGCPYAGMPGPSLGRRGLGPGLRGQDDVQAEVSQDLAAVRISEDKVFAKSEDVGRGVNNWTGKRVFPVHVQGGRSAGVGTADRHDFAQPAHRAVHVARPGAL
ncbi:unnamed protein product [Ectocarpus fasciculatus]